MESIECQMIEGGTGDFILVRGKHQPVLTAEVEKRPTRAGAKKQDEPYYKPGADPVEFKKGGRINWFGRDPEWKDMVGFRGKRDVEQANDWNDLECVCNGDSIVNVLNGAIVNAGTGASHTKGKILFQSEGAELFFRRIELVPLKK